MSHSRDKFVLFVPHWIARILDREKISYTKLLNLSQLRSHLSVEDISILYWLNINHPLFSGSDGQEYGDMMLSRVWKRIEDREYVINKIVPMEIIAKDAIASRLRTVNESSTDQPAFKINVVSEVDIVIVVTVFPGGDSNNLTALSSELLKLLYAHTGYDDMARSHLFKGYIERLALANNAL
jgi:hypothetical protein